MRDYDPDTRNGVGASPEAPAEALRQQLQSFKLSPLVIMELPPKYLDYIMELVTAYAATVEREGRADELKQLPGIRYTDNKGIEIEERYISYSHYVARLAALQGPLDEG